MEQKVYMLMKHNTETGEIRWVGTYLNEAEATTAGQECANKPPASTYYFVVLGTRYGG